MKALFLSILVLTALSIKAGDETRQTVKGTHIMLKVPPGFTASKAFSGFTCKSVGVSLIVSELPGSYKEVAHGFNNPAALKSKGMRLLSNEKASYGSHNGILLALSQKVRGTEFLKWTAIWGDELTTYLVVASFPKQTEAEYSKMLKEAVLSARQSNSSIDPAEALTFDVSPAGDIKLAKITGNMILFSKDGIFPLKNPGEPSVIALGGINKEILVTNKKLFAEKQLKSTEKLKNITIQEIKPVQIGGLDGFASTAQAEDEKSSASLKVYQVILFDYRGYYYLVHAMAAEAEFDACLPLFKQMAESFKKREVKN